MCLDDAGSTDIAADLRKGATINGKAYKVHLDGYNQLVLLSGEDKSKRDEIWYFAEANIGAARIGDYKYSFLDQPEGWFGPKQQVNWPILTNLRADPFERCNNFANCPSEMMDFFAHEFWRFTFVQQRVGELAKTFVEFPPQQDSASFNLDQAKKKIKEMQDKMKSGHPGA